MGHHLADLEHKLSELNKQFENDSENYSLFLEIEDLVDEIWDVRDRMKLNNSARKLF